MNNELKIILSKEADEILEDSASKLGVDKAEYIRRALALIAHIINNSDNYKVALIDNEGNVIKEILLGDKPNE